MSEDTAKRHILHSLANPSPATEVAVDRHLDAVQSVIAKSDLSDQFIASLAGHYGMQETEVERLLLAHSAGIMWYLTNSQRSATKADFFSLLRTLNTRLGRLARTLEDRASQVDEAILQAEVVQAECIKVLTQFKQRKLKEAAKQSNIT